jgi:hypothetical protein
LTHSCPPPRPAAQKKAAPKKAQLKKQPQSAKKAAASGGRMAVDGAPGAGGRRRSGKGAPPAANLSITVRGAVAKKAAAPPRRSLEPPRARPDARVEARREDYGAPLPPLRGPRDPSTAGTKLFVGNLNYKVTREDVRELFEACGALASHEVHFNARGQPAGSAEVVFRDRRAAAEAQARYNEVALDGRPMRIELIERAERRDGGGGGGGGGRVLKSGLRLGQRVVTVRRDAGPARGRGGDRGGAMAMQD